VSNVAAVGDGAAPARSLLLRLEVGSMAFGW